MSDEYLRDYVSKHRERLHYALIAARGATSDWGAEEMVNALSAPLKVKGVKTSTVEPLGRTDICRRAPLLSLFECQISESPDGDLVVIIDLITSLGYDNDTCPSPEHFLRRTCRSGISPEPTDGSVRKGEKHRSENANPWGFADMKDRSYDGESGVVA